MSVCVFYWNLFFLLRSIQKCFVSYPITRNRQQNRKNFWASAYLSVFNLVNLSTCYFLVKCTAQKRQTPKQPIHWFISSYLFNFAACMPAVMHMCVVCSCTCSYKLDWTQNGRKRHSCTQTHSRSHTHSLTHSHFYGEGEKNEKERKKRKIEWDFGTMKSGFRCCCYCRLLFLFCVYGRWRARAHSFNKIFRLM